MRLCWEDPNRHLLNYRDWLLLLIGNKVSMDIRGSLVKPNLIPLDKFKPENHVRALNISEHYSLSILRRCSLSMKIIHGEKNCSTKRFEDVLALG